MFKKFKAGNAETSLVKEILNIVKDVREIQSNQVPVLFLSNFFYEIYIKMAIMFYNSSFNDEMGSFLRSSF